MYLYTLCTRSAGSNTNDGNNIFGSDAIKLGNRKGHIMIRIIVSSKKTHEPMCYHNVKDMREADRMAEDYSQIKGIKVEVLLLAATDEQATALQRERGY